MKLFVGSYRVLFAFTLFAGACAVDSETDAEQLLDEGASEEEDEGFADESVETQATIEKATPLVSLNCRVNDHATAAAHLVNPINNVVSYAPIGGFLQSQSVGAGSFDWTAGPGKGYKADRIAFFLKRGNGGVEDWFSFGKADGILDVPVTIRGHGVKRMNTSGIPGNLFERVIMKVYTASGSCTAESKLPAPTSADAG
jgi:hypothetical protein